MSDQYKNNKNIALYHTEEDKVDEAIAKFVANASKEEEDMFREKAKSTIVGDREMEIIKKALVYEYHNYTRFVKGRMQEV